MARGAEQGTDGVLEEAEAAFERWRQDRGGKRQRIPEPLWRLAVEAAASHGTHRVARRLRLNPSRLKERVAQAEAAERPDPEATPAAQPEFVELPVSAGPAESSCVLEAETAAGARMRIELRGAATAQAESMARLLWEGRA